MYRFVLLVIFSLLFSALKVRAEPHHDLIVSPDSAEKLSVPVVGYLRFMPESQEVGDIDEVKGALPRLLNKPLRYAYLWITNTGEKDIQLFVSNNLPMKVLQIAGPFPQLPETGNNLTFGPSVRIPKGRSSVLFAFESGKLMTRFDPYLSTKDVFLAHKERRQVLILAMMGIMIGTWLYNFFLTLIAGYKNYGYFLLGSLFLDLFVCSLTGLPTELQTSLTDPYLLETWYFWLGFLLYFLTKFLLTRSPLTDTRRKLLILPSKMLIIACICAYFSIPRIPRFWEFLHPIFIVGAIIVPYYILASLIRSPLHRREGMYSVFSWSPLGVCGVVIVLFYMGSLPSNLIYPGMFAAASMQTVLTTSFLIALRFQEDKNNQTRLDQLLSIAQDVQTLLVPSQVDTTSPSGTLALRHTSSSSQLSGNWGHAWQTPDGATNVMLGNVDGKGPRAALAVASIISLVKESVRNNLDLKESLAEISTTLWSIYRGSCSSSVTAFHIDHKGYLESFGGESVGWFLARAGKVSHESGRGSPLGISSILKLRFTKVQLHPGDTVIAILDATSRSSREIKRLASNLKTLTTQTQNPQDLCEAVLKQIKKRGGTDDTTVLTYTYNAAVHPPQLADQKTTKSPIFFPQ